MCSTKWPQNKHLAVLTLCENKNILDRDRFLCLSNDWTMYLMTELFWTAYKVANGILQFVAKMTLSLKHMLNTSTILDNE
jgi:hypothetical protein